jgi:putative redox protein
MEVILKRKNNAVHFEAQNEGGITVNIDGSPEVGGEGKGVRPMQLMLMSLGGCSAIEVVNILKKQRQALEDIQVAVSGEREKGAMPSLFTEVDIAFHLKGEVDPQKAEHAIKLTLEKYCSATATLEKAGTRITYSLFINSKEYAKEKAF